MRLSRPLGQTVLSLFCWFHDVPRTVSNFQTGEPGCVFLDRVNEDNPLPGLGPIEASNPCGEQFLHDGDVCNLGALNATKIYDTETGKLNEAILRENVKTGIMMLEDVVDTFKLPVEKVSSMARKTRRTGLGLFGWAEYLILRGIAYDSEENLAEIRHFMGIFRDTAIEVSRELAKERGVFPLWYTSVYAKDGDERRNAFLTSMAPTGSYYPLFIPSDLHFQNRNYVDDRRSVWRC